MRALSPAPWTPRLELAWVRASTDRAEPGGSMWLPGLLRELGPERPARRRSGGSRTVAAETSCQLVLYKRMRLRPTTARPSVWAVSTEQGSREGGCRRDAGSLGLWALAGLRVLAAADNKTLQSKQKQNWFSDTQRKARSRQGGKTGRTRAVPEVAGACPAPPCFLEGSAGHVSGGHTAGRRSPARPSPAVCPVRG